MIEEGGQQKKIGEIEKRMMFFSPNLLSSLLFLRSSKSVHIESFDRPVHRCRRILDVHEESQDLRQQWMRREKSCSNFGRRLSSTHLLGNLK
jgi:hypothetical protein